MIDLLNEAFFFLSQRDWFKQAGASCQVHIVQWSIITHKQSSPKLRVSDSDVSQHGTWRQVSLQWSDKQYTETDIFTHGALRIQLAHTFFCRWNFESKLRHSVCSYILLKSKLPQALTLLCHICHRTSHCSPSKLAQR